MSRKNRRNTLPAGVRRLGGMSPYVAGTALFDGWYMKGTLSGYDTMFLLLGRGELKKGALKVQHNEGVGGALHKGREA